MMVAALSFQPVFVYIALGLSGVIAFSRLVLGLALSTCRVKESRARRPGTATGPLDIPGELGRRAASNTAGAPGSIDGPTPTHAELLVPPGQLDTSRERLIREAHELASMLLGEPTYGATIGQALARVEVRDSSNLV